MITEVKGKCTFEECEADATEIACGRAGYTNQYEGTVVGHPEPALYCETHGEIVADEQCPEYHDNCPNCGCRFGVN